MLETSVTLYVGNSAAEDGSCKTGRELVAKTGSQSRTGSVGENVKFSYVYDGKDSVGAIAEQRKEYM